MIAALGALFSAALGLLVFVLCAGWILACLWAAYRAVEALAYQTRWYLIRRRDRRFWTRLERRLGLRQLDAARVLRRR